ncbi:MAG: YwiC-like family protein, partial [Dehalococcoidia bacterium]|nr:YwiC-like family protein [Dehalococcoidia bacterium]
MEIVETVNEARHAGVNRGTLIRSVALPSEHGGWSFLLEPILLGLAVAPSWLGALLGVSALGAFLTHQPLKTAIKDRLKGRRPPRAIWAERFALGYGAIALIPLVVVAVRAPSEALTPL